MNYLDQNEQKRMKLFISEIEDKMYAIKVELQNERAYKSYLKEKMDSINWNIKCINNLLGD